MFPVDFLTAYRGVLKFVFEGSSIRLYFGSFGSFGDLQLQHRWLRKFRLNPVPGLWPTAEMLSSLMVRVRISRRFHPDTARKLLRGTGWRSFGLIGLRELLPPPPGKQLPVVNRSTGSGFSTLRSTSRKSLPTCLRIVPWMRVSATVLSQWRRYSFSRLVKRWPFKAFSCT